MGAFEGLLEQIDRFIKKYYKNQMLRGVLLFFLIFLAAFIVVTLLEYFGRFNTVIRAVLFFGFIALNLVIFIKYFVVPCAKLFSFGKRISRKQAAAIIGSFFPDIKDRLLNTLQLNQNVESNTGNIELLRASVSQRAKTMSAIPFTNAIDYKENRGYLKFLIPVVFLLVLLGVFLPNAFKDSTTRLVNYNEKFVLPTPFDFNLLTSNLTVEEGETLDIDLEIVPKQGEELPTKVYLKNSRGLFLMKRNKKNRFSYPMLKVDKPQSISFKSNGFESDLYSVSVVGKTVVPLLEVRLNYPAYLELEDKVIRNVGDLVVPEGTKLEWNVKTENAKQVNVKFGKENKVFKVPGFRFDFTALSSSRVTFLLENSFIDKFDSLAFAVDVVKDGYPSIQVGQFIDSLSPTVRTFSGFAEDDKGLRNIKFIYNVTDKEGNVRSEAQPVPGVRGVKSTINMLFDISSVPLNNEDKLTYYFVVFDNDAVNGYKSSKSQVFTYKAPSKDEVAEQREESTNAAKSSMSDLFKRSELFKNEVNNLKKDLFESKNTDWNQMQQIEALKKEQMAIQKELEKVKKELENSMDDKEKFSAVDEELAEKQKLIESLMESMMDEEMMDLLKQLEEMMAQQDQESIQEIMEEMNMSSEEMSKNLDRTLEQLKKMQVEEKLDEVIDKLNELALQQKKLSEMLKSDSISSEDAFEKQESLKDEFKKLEEEYKDVLDNNNDLDRPFGLDDLEEDREEVDDKQQESSENLQKDKKTKSAEAGEKAAKKMKEMAAKMESMQAQSKADQAEEDIDTLRGILESLMELSFNQEENMMAFGVIRPTDPLYTSLGRMQRSIIDDNIPVQDSLLALAKRVPKVSAFVDKELATIRMNFNVIPDDIDERRTTALEVKQQYVMTAFNNLSLFLNETLQNMQSDMQSDKSGSGSCDNPGGSGKKGKSGESMDGMKEMLKKQLESMKKGMNPGGDKPGGSDGVPIPFGSKQAAQMAAQQNAIREKLNQMKNDLNKEGQGKGNELNKLLQELEDQQERLINKDWNANLINRQQDILTRLLESEKALEERGFDEKRESKAGENNQNGNQIQFIEYNKLKAQQIELLRSVSPEFDRYYNERASEYFNRVN